MLNKTNKFNQFVCATVFDQTTNIIGFYLAVTKTARVSGPQQQASV